jgi:uncharacterized protein (TIGR03118 family)
VTNVHRIATLATLIGASLLGTTAADSDRGYVETDLVVDKQVDGVPTLTDKNGIVHQAKFFDPNLVNPWGVGESATSPFWVADNGASVSTLYNSQGQPLPLVVAIPAPGDPLGASGAPTGLVFNLGFADGAFKISGVTSTGDPISAPARFLFATEDGTILGWNPDVNPPGADPATFGRHAIIAVDLSAAGAVFKGLTMARDPISGGLLLYATDFHNRRIDVFDSSFAPAPLPSDAFSDPHLPGNYSPFDVVPITIDGSTELFVTFAIPNAEGKDDVAGEGHGIVDTFDLTGHMLDRFAQHGQLNSPWGVALAPPGFGEFGGDILIGNFGNGRINAFDPRTGHFRGKLRDSRGKAITIDGLWTIRFGNGGNGGDPKLLYFTAGPNDESDGIFGSLAPAAED